ncbi:MAG: methyltransferase domain-containing protein, partial [Thermomicrobiaceae bacterium]|nr:methyltransferase domain-containing protein [Thermomicrobiaceae bacterium]
QGFLSETLRRARARGLPNVRATRGDAQALPYRASHFDGAFLVATLGEVPDKSAALRELRRVIRPGGRLVVGEGLPDPHMVSAPALERLASEAGFRLERRVGGRLGYLASLVAE